MVACGHSFGGVRSDDFPQLVAPNPNSIDPVIVDFDTTPAFDNLVCVFYTLFDKTELIDLQCYRVLGRT